MAPPSGSQSFVYSGREYLKLGRSWAQVTEFNTVNNRKTQLTTTWRHHFSPWCTPDGKSVLFTSTPENGKESLYRFDRLSKQESLSVALDQKLFRVTDAIDDSLVVVEEFGAVIEIIDVKGNRKLRKFSGVRPVLSSDHTLIAWQTPVDKVLHPEQRSHILMARVDGTGEVDLGEGYTPVFQRDNKSLIFVRPQTQGGLDLIRYDVEAERHDVTPTKGDLNDPFEDPYGLTISPDVTTIMLSACCGRYGSAVYWRLTSDQTWKRVDDNLGSWGEWSQDGLLVYAADGRDLRPLDENRGVWVGDIKLFDSRTGLTNTVVQGVSQNEDPRWCRQPGR
jgi:hypothetical protein